MSCIRRRKLARRAFTAARLAKAQEVETAILDTVPPIDPPTLRPKPTPKKKVGHKRTRYTD